MLLEGVRSLNKLKPHQWKWSWSRDIFKKLHTPDSKLLLN